MKSRVAAFTLIEIVVIVAIIGLTTTFGFMSFFRFQERQAVENTAKEILAYLRQVQNYARVGERGMGIGCRSALENVAKNESNLMSWETEIHSGSLSDVSLQSEAVCGVPSGRSGELSEFGRSSSVAFRPTRSATNSLQFSVVEPNSGMAVEKITFEALFGDTNPQAAIFTVHDGNKNCHQFELVNGAFTDSKRGKWEGGKCILE